MSAGRCEPLETTLIGNSAAMHRLRAMIAKVARSTIPVLIQGPTGSGKELVARAIHDISGRSGPFVAFNVCAEAETMFEDALFGHVRGAYTGAGFAKKGYLCEAHGGTLFLDEVSGLALGRQAKLLRALETKEYRPLGAEVDRRSDFRTVAATNVDLSDLVAAGAFRPDLRYRLGAFVLNVPALSERRQDVAALAHHFAVQASRRDGVIWSGFTEDAIHYLTMHEWSGNVRELKHTVESLVLLAAGRSISRHDLAAILMDGPVPEVRARHDEFMGRRLVEVLDSHNWNVPAAARELGVDKTTVYRRLRRLGLRDLPREFPARNGDRVTEVPPVAIRGATTAANGATNCHARQGDAD